MRRADATGAILAIVAIALASISSTANAQTARTQPAVSENVDRSERITRASVIILSGRSVRARGVVIAMDGRIATALTPLGTETSFTVRYPNGHTAEASVVATEPSWGVALLQPRVGPWGEGLQIATNVRGNSPVRWTVGDEPHSLGGRLRRRRTFVGPNSELLRDAWELDAGVPDNAVGSGIANPAGELVGILVPPDPSVPAGGASVLFGAPASIVHDLIDHAGNTARPWLGLIARNPHREDTDAIALSGLRVTQVIDAGPADRAGIRAGNPGDVIIGTTDRAIHSIADLGSVLQGRHPGDTLMLRLVRRGVTFDLPVVLTEAPPP